MAVRTTPLADIYRNSPVFQDLRNPDKYKGKCEVCEFRYVCGGSRSRAFAMTGDYMESEPFCVYIPKTLREQKKTYKKRDMSTFYSCPVFYLSFCNCTWK